MKKVKPKLRWTSPILDVMTGMRGREMITALHAWQGRIDFPSIVVHLWCLIVLHKLSRKVHIAHCLNGAREHFSTFCSDLSFILLHQRITRYKILLTMQGSTICKCPHNYSYCHWDAFGKIPAFKHSSSLPFWLVDSFPWPIPDCFCFCEPLLCLCAQDLVIQMASQRAMPSAEIIRTSTGHQKHRGSKQPVFLFCSMPTMGHHGDAIHTSLV